jgi:Flp pilus assembly protein TadB
MELSELPQDPKELDEWLQRMNDAVAERSWALAIKKLADASLIVAGVGMLSMTWAWLRVSPGAAAITGAFILGTTSVAMSFVARRQLKRSATQVGEWAEYLKESLRPPRP